MTTLLTGSEAPAERVGGRLGRWMAAISARLRSSGQGEGPSGIDVAVVKEIEPLVELKVSKDELSEIAGLERWLAANFIGRLPRSGDASE